jgi:chromosome segregation ATPase
MILKKLPLPRILAISALMGMSVLAHADQALKELEGYVIDNAQAIVDAGENRQALQRDLRQLREEKQQLKATVDKLVTRLDQLAKALEQSTALIKTYADKASQAEHAAKAHANTKASQAEWAAKAHADTKSSQAERAAKAYASTKASQAERAAKVYASTRASQAERAAKDYANAKVNNLGENNCHWTGYFGKWTLAKNGFCPGGYYLKGVGFKHRNDHNHTNEESFRLYCCRLK